MNDHVVSCVKKLTAGPQQYYRPDLFHAFVVLELMLFANGVSVRFYKRGGVGVSVGFDKLVAPLLKIVKCCPKHEFAVFC